MGHKLRLDKLLAHMGFGTRSELKRLAKSGSIQVNGSTVKDSGLQVDPNTDRIMVHGEEVRYREFVYLMMHKPPGVVSATEDTRDRTVIDLLPDEYRAFDPFPVGRLDKDTEGLLLLTNDGKLAHNLLSPRKHVPKTYYAAVQGNVGESDIRAFATGVTLDDGYRTLPAELRVVQPAGTAVDGLARIELTITEGKFHQVKRMFEAVEKKVVYLQRLTMGPLTLDPELPIGAVRELTAAELEALQQSGSKDR
jgi:16S rRNA pseudouridine516 synthase